MIAFLVIVLFAPYVRIGVEFRVEHLLVPAFLFIALLARKPLLVPAAALLLIGWWAWLLFGTSFSILGGGPADTINWVQLYAFLKPALVVMLFASYGFGWNEALRLIRYFTYTAIPLGLLAVGQSLGISWVQVLTVTGYTSLGRTPVFALTDYFGHILRATSVFESPAYAAVYFLLALGTGVLLLTMSPVKLKRGQRLALVFSVLTAAAGGLLTLSATFVAGLGLLAVFLLFVVGRRVRLKALGVGLLVLFVLVFLGSFFARTSPEISGALAYQLDRVLRLQAFDTRYGEGAFLDATIAAAFERPIGGWGLTHRPDVFIGDSLYVVLFYYGGVVGLGLFLTTMISVLRPALHAGFVGKVLVLWLLIMLAGGFGAPSFFIPRLGDWWWALVGIVIGGYKRWRTQSI